MAIETINITARGQTLICEPVEMASDTINEIRCVFNLSQDWTSFGYITAVFENKYGNKYAQTIVNNECMVPGELLTEKGNIFVNLCGFVVEGNVKTLQLTTYKSLCVKILQKVHTSGLNSTQPTPTQVEQFLALLNATYAKVEREGDEVTITIRDQHGTTEETVKDGEKGETGSTGPAGVGISSIAKTGSSGLVDTYTITFTNGTTTTFQVTNGEDGEDGEDGSIVEASSEGTSTDVANYITIDGVEYKIGGGSSGLDLSIIGGKLNVSFEEE